MAWQGLRNCGWICLGSILTDSLGLTRSNGAWEDSANLSLCAHCLQLE